MGAVRPLGGRVDTEARHKVLAEERKRRGDLVLRALPILFIPVFTAGVAFVLVLLASPSSAIASSGTGHERVVLPVIVMAVFLTSLIILVRVGRPTMSALLLIGVWTLVTTLTTLRGGITGIGPAFLIIPICAAGLLIDGVASMSLAALATLLVGSLAWLEMNGVYSAPDQFSGMAASPFPMMALPAFLAAAWTGLYWTVAALTSLLAGGLQRALEQTRQQAEALRELSNQLEARVAEQTAELAQRATRAEALYAVSQALTSTLDLERVLALITEQAAHLLGFDSAQVLLSQPDGSFASLEAYPRTVADGPAMGNGAERRAADGAAAWEVQAAGRLLREVVERRKARVVWLAADGNADGDGDGQAGMDESGNRAAPPAVALAAGSALILPMHYAERVAGALMLTNANGEANCSGDDLVLGQGLADQAAVAIANAQLLGEAREAATLEERTRLARDIHDTLAQGLTGVVVQLGATQRALSLAPNEAREHLGVALRMARESLAEARRSVWNLRAPALDRGDLSDALRALTVRPLGAHVAVTFEQRGEPWALSTAVESTLLRVGQEALVNVAKHAQASEASVVLEYGPDRVQLRIRDNGIGLERQALDEVSLAPGPWGGFGLVGMRERVEALGGRLEISSEGGVEIVAAVPRAGDVAEQGDISRGDIGRAYLQTE
jgi:signal transduction histidine kinase